MQIDTLSFLFGGLFVAALIISLFFLRYWKNSRDRLFLFFSTAFLILAIERIAPFWFYETHEMGYLVYLFRLTAFAIIILGIVDRNRRT